MCDYVIYTDSACDLKPELLQKWGLRYSSMTFKFDDSPVEYFNGDMESADFYRKMREGGVAKTSAINAEAFLTEFEDALQQGRDVLYIGFSSGLSATYNAARIAAQELRYQYPERKIVTVDSLSGSAGQGLLLYLTLEQKKKGATLEEAAAFAEELRHKICHWVTVDNLVYLKRGGRISPTVAFVGNVLGLKPMLCIDDTGKVIGRAKVRGRKKALEFLVEKYGEVAEVAADGIVFVSHADASKDAEEVAAQLRCRYNASVRVITDIGPVIGAHAGPGAVAIFFVGRER